MRVGKLAILSLCAWLGAASASDPCSDDTTARANVERLESDLIELREQRKALEANTQKQINDAADELVRNGTWKDKDRAGFFAAEVESSSFLAAEKEKRAELALFGLAAQTMLTRKDKGDFKAACVSANDMRASLARIGAINDSQYEQMRKRVLAAGSAKR